VTIVLGIDPGSRITGYGVVQACNNKIRYIDSGCIRTSTENFSQRLLQIFNGICQLMDEYSPTEVAIEQVFTYKNPSSALKLGHARGVAMVACASHRVAIHEYSPREVKQSLVGYGGADKAQVKHMVVNILSLTKEPQSDAADALGIAICHLHKKNLRRIYDCNAAR